MTIPPTETLAKGKSKNTGKGKGKHVDVVETEQPQPSETASTVSYLSQTPSTIGALSFNPNEDPWIMSVAINSVSSTKRHAGARSLLLDSVALTQHEDHIAGKGDNSLQHYNLVQKFIPLPQAMKIPAAKAAVDKEWEKLEKISAWNLTKVRRKKEVIEEARTSGAIVHLASLMDICHLKNAELEAKHQK